jgi:hypothetical protein
MFAGLALAAMTAAVAEPAAKSIKWQTNYKKAAAQAAKEKKIIMVDFFTEH